MVLMVFSGMVISTKLMQKVIISTRYRLIWVSISFSPKNMGTDIFSLLFSLIPALLLNLSPVFPLLMAEMADILSSLPVLV